MKYSKLIPVIFSLLLSSCIKEVSDDIPNAAIESTLDGIVVPDGFEFDMYEHSSYSIEFGSAGRMLSTEALQYAVVGVDTESELHALQSGFAFLSDGLNLNIDKPIHITDLFLFTKYDGNSKYFPLDDPNLSLEIADLIVDDDFFNIQNARVSGDPACISFLGNATQIRCRNDGISIKSSSSINYIDCYISENEFVRTFPEDNSENKNNNQWFYEDQVGGVSVFEILKFEVNADCMYSPQFVDTALVTFENPCYEESKDDDGDGVPNETDIEPNDGSIAAVSYIPAKEKFSTYAFEDLWPYKGDFDFNDLVVSHNSTIYVNANNRVTKVAYQFLIRAIGAGFDNDFCVSFSGNSAGVILDSMNSDELSYEQIDLNESVEFRFKHIKKVFEGSSYINTDSTMTFQEPVSIGFRLLLDGSVSLEDFVVDEYLRIDQEEGREVHKPGRSYTSLADLTLFGTASDDTRMDEGKYYQTSDNLPWVIEIPQEWEYPEEKSRITQAYPKFKEFAQGKSNTPWYTDEEGNKVYKHIYRKKK